MPFSPESVLFRAPVVNVRLANEITVEAGGRGIVTTDHVLAILRVFAQPMTVSDALSRLGAGSPQDWVDLSSAILHLREAGILRDSAEPNAYDEVEGFAAARVHIEMLNDRVRTDSFLAALRESVRPGDVVVDIGTGTGVLAVAAVRAGAARVYAVEETSIGQSARALFDSNGVSDRVTLVPGRSSRIELPERANVVVSEILGNDIFDEKIIEVFRDARQRLTTSDVRLIPRRIRVLALPLEIPQEELAKLAFDPVDLERWRELYGTSFEALTQRPDKSSALFRPAQRTRSWRRMGAPTLLAEVDLGQVDSLDVDGGGTCVVTEEGKISGFLVYFESDLSPTVTLSMHPDAAGPASSWNSKITILSTAAPVAPGDHVRLRYSFRNKSRLEVEALTRHSTQSSDQP